MKFIKFNDLGILEGRYDSEIHGEGVPSRALKVSEDLFWKTINEQDGIWKIIDGQIVKAPFPEPTAEERVAACEQIRKDLKTKADKAVSKYQDMVDVSDASTEEKAMLKKWKQYRVALHRLDLTKNVAWPITPE